MTFQSHTHKAIQKIKARLQKENKEVLLYILSEIERAPVKQEVLARNLKKRFTLYSQCKTVTIYRRVQELIFILRTQYYAPILGGSRGYYIPQTHEEALKRLTRMRNDAIKHSKSAFAVIESGKIAFNINDKLL